MTAVTVDLQDLEKIVFASSAIKIIESTLAGRKNDPFVRPHLDFTEAHERLATAMRNATRAAAGTLVNFDEPLTKTEARALRYILEAVDERKAGLPWFVISAADKAAEGEDMSIYDRLSAKGCIQIGMFITGVVWTGAPAPDIKADPDRGYAARITARGRSLLTASEASTVLGAG